MTIDDLKQVRSLTLEIVDLQRQISYDYMTYRSPSFEKIGSSPLSPSDPTAQAVEQIRKAEAKLEYNLYRVGELKAEIETWISTVEDSEVRRIIRLHFMQNLTWKETAKAIWNYEDSSAAKMRFYRWWNEHESVTECSLNQW